MKILNMISSLIFKITSQHLLKNGAGENPVLSNDSSGAIAGFLQSVVNAIADKIQQAGVLLYRILCKFVYFLVKLALNIMDFLMVCVSELCGQASGYNMDVANSNLEKSDILFKFLLNSYTLKILRRLFIYALLLLILITIFAIVMNEWKNASGNKDGSFAKVLIKSLKTLFTMFLTPFIVIIGIVASNVILASCVEAVSLDGSNRFSVGAVVFNSATYNANWYRCYADNNDKIPILFDFNGGFYSVENSDDVFTDGGSITEETEKLLENPYLTSGYSTYSMFRNGEYFNFNQISDDSAYYSFYDGEYLKTKRIEYYVMSDFVDFAMQSGDNFYIMNVEDVYNNAISILERYPDFYPAFIDGVIDLDDEDCEYNLRDVLYMAYFSDIFNNIIPIKVKDGIEEEVSIFSNDGKVQFNRGEVEYYKFTVNYNETLSEQMGDMEGHQVDYISYAGARDEAEGAKYVFCEKVSLRVNNETNEYATLYVPVLDNTRSTIINDTTLFKFDSDYLSYNPYYNDEQNEEETTPRVNYKDILCNYNGTKNIRVNSNLSMFVAKGAFTVTGLPTAIRQDGSNITFYRHDISVPKNIKLQPLTSYLKEEENGEVTIVGENDDIFSRVLGFDSNKINSDIKLVLKSTNQFNKGIFSVGTFDNGMFTLNYSFVNTPLDITNVYDITEVNMVILVLISGSLLMTLFNIIWVLLKRLLELTVYWFTYPAWLLKYPLGSSDSILEDSTYQMWRMRFIERVLCVYGVYIGLALYYTLVPAVISANLFESVKLNVGANNFLENVSPEFVAWVMDALFVTVLFTFVKKIDGEIAGLVMSGNLQSGSELSSSGADIFKSVGGNIVGGVKQFSVINMAKTAKGKVGQITNEALGSIPGGAMLNQASNLAQKVSTNVQYNRDLNKFKQDMKSATNDTRANAILGSTPIAKNQDLVGADGKVVKDGDGNTVKVNSYEQTRRDMESTRERRESRILKPKGKK